MATREVSRALADEFGDVVLNPPATPIVVIDTDGTVTLTDFGHKSTAELVDLDGEPLLGQRRRGPAHVALGQRVAVVADLGDAVAMQIDIVRRLLG
mgnify:CR=1 FL=1